MTRRRENRDSSCEKTQGVSGERWCPGMEVSRCLCFNGHRHAGFRQCIPAGFNSRNRNASRSDRLAFHLVQQLAIVLDDVFGAAKGVSSDQRIREQQQRCGKQRIAFLSNWPAELHIGPVAIKCRSAFCHERGAWRKPADRLSAANAESSRFIAARGPACGRRQGWRGPGTGARCRHRREARCGAAAAVRR